MDSTTEQAPAEQAPAHRRITSIEVLCAVLVVAILAQSWLQDVLDVPARCAPGPRCSSRCACRRCRPWYSACPGAGSWWSSRSETTGGLERDLIEVLTWMCARLYGRRGARNRAVRAVSATTLDPVGEVPDGVPG